MKSLVCEACGGPLDMQVNEQGQAIGRCRHCLSEYLVDDQRTQHVVVEHKFDMPPAPPPIPVNRRAVIAAGVAAGVVVMGAIGMAALQPRPKTARKRVPGKVLFNVGGAGAETGQFRTTPRELMIDSAQRALVMDNGGNGYLFGPAGELLGQFPNPTQGNVHLVAMRPDGVAICQAGNTLLHVDPRTGRVVKRQPWRYKDDHDNRYLWVFPGVPLPGGGFALYADGKAGRETPSLPGEDVLVAFDADGNESGDTKRLILQAMQPAPMLDQAPQVSSVAADADANLYVAVTRHPQAKVDTRAGVYVFNAAGAFLRMQPMEFRFSGRIATTAAGVLYGVDPWMDTIQRAVHGNLEGAELSAFSRVDMPGFAQPSSIALYPDGDVALLTTDDRLVRLRWPQAQTV